MTWLLFREAPMLLNQRGDSSHPGLTWIKSGSGYCQIKAFPYGEFASGWPSLKLKHRNPRSVLLSRNSSTCKVLLKHGGPPKTSQVLLQVLSFILLQYLILGTVPIFFLDVKIFRLCPYQPYHSRVKTCRQKHRFHGFRWLFLPGFGRRWDRGGDFWLLLSVKQFILSCWSTIIKHPFPSVYYGYLDIYGSSIPMVNMFFTCDIFPSSLSSLIKQPSIRTL